MGWKIPDSVREQTTGPATIEVEQKPEDIVLHPELYLKPEENVAALQTKTPVELAREEQARKERAARKAREERARIESCGGTVIPRSDVPVPSTQSEYDALQRAQDAEVQRLLEEQTANMLFNPSKPIVRGCTTCLPSQRYHGPDCVGHCETLW
jgi:hypothetical protein